MGFDILLEYTKGQARVKLSTVPCNLTPVILSYLESEGFMEPQFVEA